MLESSARFQFTEANAAVKALVGHTHILSLCASFDLTAVLTCVCSLCTSGTSATGAATADRHIRFYNHDWFVNKIDTESQMCSLVWSPKGKELLSGHGFSENQLTWKYSTLTRVELRPCVSGLSGILSPRRSPRASVWFGAAPKRTSIICTLR